MRYILVQDNDCHWYIIPVDRIDDWDEWCKSNEWEAPRYAASVGGHPSLVTFTNPKIED